VVGLEELDNVLFSRCVRLVLCTKGMGRHGYLHIATKAIVSYVTVLYDRWAGVDLCIGGIMGSVNR
jgi:hypothetical protein